ncbi:hypothetical protein CMZ82_09605 [Lysobacteraceae bacterium NML93-0792]|nr:hypothetical protein CMZ82_09605 [Xanthomonadaceae bacterium NML93-0792]PBS15949.1 hypothetical protein CMZ81_08425 [Xanthomonadaceae bacterium NML93-0793]PBS18870.1 hypothetical protein CMZ80_09170 [Xanthomonadaceae bacterium NML93-0831]
MKIPQCVLSIALVQRPNRIAKDAAAGAIHYSAAIGHLVSGALLQYLVEQIDSNAFQERLQGALHVRFVAVGEAEVRAGVHPDTQPGGL